ncbi:hypothetical protein ABLN64_12390, partial [Mycobacterium tuberculosis]
PVRFIIWVFSRTTFIPRVVFIYRSKRFRVFRAPASHTRVSFRIYRDDAFAFFVRRCTAR